LSLHPSQVSSSIYICILSFGDSKSFASFDLILFLFLLISPHIQSLSQISNDQLYILTELSLKSILSLHSIFIMRSTLSTIVALASGLQLASAVCKLILSMRSLANIYRVGLMPLPSLALPIQTTNVIVNNPAGLTGAVSAWVLSPHMVTLNLRASPVPALSVAVSSVIFSPDKLSRYARSASLDCNH
jgi:hypothetical protein